MKRYFAGLDVGSTYTKALLLDQHQNILSKSVRKTKPSMSYAANACFSDLIKRENLERQFVYVTATGYGKELVEFADSKAIDILCVAKAVNHTNADVRTIIEAGGQDTKVLRIDEKGKVLDFVINDKCSAGTGQFLELMAQILGVKLEDLAKLSINSTKQLTITSTCSVFAQTEVVSLLSEGEKREDIIKALHRSISSRIYELMLQVDIENAVCMVGGVALNSAVVNELEQIMEKDLFVADKPQFTAAYGAALKGYKQCQME